MNQFDKPLGLYKYRHSLKIPNIPEDYLYFFYFTDSHWYEWYNDSWYVVSPHVSIPTTIQPISKLEFLVVTGKPFELPK